MKQEASFSLDVGLILVWKARCLFSCPAESDLECWQLPPASAVVQQFGQVHIGTAVPSPHFLLLWHQRWQMNNLWVSQFRERSIHPFYFLLCLLHPKKAQMLQLLQGRIGSQQGRLRAIWIWKYSLFSEVCLCTAGCLESVAALQCLSSGRLSLSLCSFLLCISASEEVGGSAFSWCLLVFFCSFPFPPHKNQKIEGLGLFSSSLYQCGLWDLFLKMCGKRWSNRKVGILPSSDCADQCEVIVKQHY